MRTYVRLKKENSLKEFPICNDYNKDKKLDDCKDDIFYRILFNSDGIL